MSVAINNNARTYSDKIHTEQKSTNTKKHHNPKQQTLNTREQRQRINNPQALLLRGGKMRHDTSKLLHPTVQEQALEFVFYFTYPLPMVLMTHQSRTTSTRSSGILGCGLLEETCTAR